eukprot:5539261-Pyramimonas_sp.AAC.1
MQEIAKASNIMPSRYVFKWEFVNNEKGEMERAIRLPRRSSQRVLASAAACKKQWTIASLGIIMTFLKGSTYRDFVEATCEKERVACFTLPPGSAIAFRTLPGFLNYDESEHCLQCLKLGTGTKDAPLVFSLKLRRTTRGFGLRP